MTSLIDIFRTLTRPLGTRSLSELVFVSALCHLLAFLVVNFSAWLFPKDFTPFPTSVEMVTEQQLQQHLSQYRASSQKKITLESAKPKEEEKEEEEKEEEEKQEKEKEETKEVKLEAEKTPKKAAKKIVKETATSAEKPSREQIKSPDSADKSADSSDLIEDILTSLEEETSSDDGQKSEPSFDESLDEALGEQSPDSSEPQFLSSEQILTAGELAAFRKHIFACWSPPIGAPSSDNLVVDLDLTLDENAYVIEVRVIDKSRMSRDPFFRHAAESALRTLSNSACSPLKLPLSKYALWERTILRFDPRRLFGL